VKGRGTIGHRLRLARIDAGLLARCVAAAADLSPSTLSLIELGWRDPRPEEVERIARAIGIDPRDLSPSLDMETA
jgi:transcriptional regulator with XRE-family HTH domain